MKKYTLIFIPVIFVLLYVNILSSESDAGCEGPVSTMTGNQCNCFRVPPITISSSETTIDPGSGVTVSVTGGCTPLTWSVSGKGYSLLDSTEGERSKILSCDPGT